ncbi:MAG TPA: hypothetical protein VGL00_02240 [Terracidiphilus sp.]
MVDLQTWASCRHRERERFLLGKEIPLNMQSTCPAKYFRYQGIDITAQTSDAEEIGLSARGQNCAKMNGPWIRQPPRFEIKFSQKTTPPLAVPTAAPTNGWLAEPNVFLKVVLNTPTVM